MGAGVDFELVLPFAMREFIPTGLLGLLKADGAKDGNSWVVVFERDLAAKGPGDHAIEAGKVYNFGIAIHEDHSAARYHYVSLGYQFGLDKPVPEIKNYINVVKQ